VYIPLNYAIAFQEEQQRSLTEKLDELTRSANEVGSPLLTAREAHLRVGVLHIRDIIRRHADAIDYLEYMLRVQLIAAIGKEVRHTPLSFLTCN